MRSIFLAILCAVVPQMGVAAEITDGNSIKCDESTAVSNNCSCKIPAMYVRFTRPFPEKPEFENADYPLDVWMKLGTQCSCTFIVPNSSGISMGQTFYGKVTSNAKSRTACLPPKDD